MWLHECPFFLKVHEIDGDKKKNFFPGGPPPGHIALNIIVNTGNNRILGHLGDIFKKGRTPEEKCPKSSHRTQ